MVKHRTTFSIRAATVIPTLLVAIPAIVIIIWWSPLLAWIRSSEFFKTNWGNIASVVGLAMTWIGFVLTISIAIRSRAAAQKAALLAGEARDAVFGFDSIVELTKAIAILEEILRRHLAREWYALPDRFVAIRTHLIAAKNAGSQMHPELRIRLSGVVQQLEDVDERVTRFLLTGKDSGAPAKLGTLLQIMKTQHTSLCEVLAELRTGPRILP